MTRNTLISINTDKFRKGSCPLSTENNSVYFVQRGGYSRGPHRKSPDHACRCSGETLPEYEKLSAGKLGAVRFSVRNFGRSSPGNFNGLQRMDLW